MSYGNVTMLEQLPELEDLESNGQNIQKFIRNSYRPNGESGMVSDSNRVEVPQGGGSQQAQLEGFQQAPQVEQHYPSDPMNMRCLDIANHVANCPICSKFYKNDTTVYIIAIVVLCIVVLLLLKKVLNV